MGRLSILFSVMLLLVAACGDGDEEVRSSAEPGAGPEEPSSDGDGPRYRGSGMVHQDGDADPMLCFSSMDSYPPQCGDGIALVGWDWADATGYDSENGVRWGGYEVEGTWDGETLTVVRFGPPNPDGPVPADDPDRFATPCDEPAGGWASEVDPALLSLEAEGALHEYIQAQPEYSASWVDNATDPAFDPARLGEYQYDPSAVVTNVRFTEDADRHEAAMRELWGGPLCVTEGGVAKSELDDVRAEVEAMFEWGWSNVDEIAGEVQLGVDVVDPVVQAELDERFGEGVVVLRGNLQPVE